jgi:hypothetical protein
MRLRAFGATIRGLSGAKGGVTRRSSKGIQMAKPKLRRAVIREWMALAREKRQSGQQALAFAKAAVQRHSLPRSRRTPHEVIVGWLRPRTGRP